MALHVYDFFQEESRLLLFQFNVTHRRLQMGIDMLLYYAYWMFPVSLWYEAYLLSLFDKNFVLSFSPGDVAVVPVISHHLLAPVRDVGTHSGQHIPYAIIGAASNIL